MHYVGGGKGALRAVPTINIPRQKFGGHAEPVIGRAFARPGGFGPPYAVSALNRARNRFSALAALQGVR